MTTPKKAPKKKKAFPNNNNKSRPKKAAPKKAARKTKVTGKRFLVARPLGNKPMATIHYDVKFFGGTGEIDLSGENIDVTLTSNDGFDVSQSVGDQVVVVAGTTGGGGAHIDVTVTENNNPIGSGSFSGNTFNSGIDYTVK